MGTPMTLTGKQFESLQAALIDAFPTPGELAVFARTRLELNLAVVSTGNLNDQTFALIRWAESRSAVPELVDAARAMNPGSASLRAFHESFTPRESELDLYTQRTSATIYDALVRLLPAQFEEVVFRLAVPTHFIPGSAAPLGERAVALVRIFEQQGRLPELGAALNRLGVRR